VFGGSLLSRMSEGTAYPSAGSCGYFVLKIAFSDIQLATNNFDESLSSYKFGVLYYSYVSLGF
jgi:hypothetical protein